MYASKDVSQLKTILHCVRYESYKNQEQCRHTSQQMTHMTHMWNYCVKVKDATSAVTKYRSLHVHFNSRANDASVHVLL